MRVELFAVPGLPEIQPGDDLGAMILVAMNAMGETLHTTDILAVAQKVVSKAEGRFRALSEINPSPKAFQISSQCGKDPRKVQAILDESTDILRVVAAPPDGIVIARHKQGWVCANAGIDESNLGSVKDQLLLLPLDPDASARRIASSIESLIGQRPGIIVTDTFGRPWRKGLVNVSLGTSEVAPIIDWIGRCDAFGRPLAVTQQALADELAAAAGLLMVKDASTPVVVFRGVERGPAKEATCRDYVRPLEEDLFR